MWAQRKFKPHEPGRSGRPLVVVPCCAGASELGACRLLLSQLRADARPWPGMMTRWQQLHGKIGECAGWRGRGRNEWSCPTAWLERARTLGVCNLLLLRHERNPVPGMTADGVDEAVRSGRAGTDQDHTFSSAPNEHLAGIGRD